MGTHPLASAGAGLARDDDGMTFDLSTLRLARLSLVFAVAAAPYLGPTAQAGGGGSPFDRVGLREAESMNADGRFVAFTSAAPLLSSDTNGVRDVFVLDRATGEVEIASVASDEGGADDRSAGPAISDTGRYVAFTSFASDLVAGDTNGVSDVFVRDLVDGTTRRISVASDGSQADGASFGASISATGRFVAFRSAAPNLFPWEGGSATEGVYVRDRRELTTTNITTLQVYGSLGDHPVISGDGRFVAWTQYQIGTSGDQSTLSFTVTDRRNGSSIASGSEGFTGEVAIDHDASIIAWTADGETVIDDRSTGSSTTVPGGSDGISVSSDGSRVFTGEQVLRAYDVDARHVEVIGVSTRRFEVVDAMNDGAAVLVNTDAPNLVKGDSGASPDAFLVRAHGGSPTPTIAAASDVTRQPDGKIVAAGTVEGGLGVPRLILARYLPDGGLDPGFGVGGIVRTGVALDGGPMAVVVAPDGRVVVGASTVSGLSVMRFTPAGARDGTFADAGRFDWPGRFGGLVVQPDGRIVVSATGKVDDYACFVNEWTYEQCDELVVLRLSLDGDLDPTFSGDGVFAFGEDERDFEGGWLARDGDGFVVISGHRVARVTSGGALDESYGVEGFAVLPARATRLAVVAGDAVVVADGSDHAFHVYRLTPSGSLDPTFGDGGAVDVPVAAAQRLAAATDVGDGGGGAIVVGGWAEVRFATPKFVSVRLDAMGEMDENFGDAGMAIVSPTAGGWGRATALVAGPTKPIVLAGAAVPRSDRAQELAIVRLTPAGDPDAAFAEDGSLTTPFAS